MDKKEARKYLRQMPKAISEGLVLKHLKTFLLSLPHKEPTYIVGYVPLKDEIDINFLMLPDITEVFDLPKVHVFIVPLFGYNERGYRLGRGGGFYDRVLEGLDNALIVGLGSLTRQVDFQEEAHDVPMDVIITERGIQWNSEAFSPSLQ